MRYHLLLAALAAAAAAAAPATAQVLGEPRPVAPDGFAASFTVPDRDATGGYRTPNAGLSAAEVTWHVRVALNVAALGCGGEDAATMPTAYNALLSAARSPLAAANAAAEEGERRRWGSDWQARHDTEQTRLYNFWAQPPAQAGFCQVARAVLAEAASVRPDEFAAFAATALPRLEAPFLAAYARWDAYRAAVTAWNAGHAPISAPVVMAAVAPVAPVATVVVAAPPVTPVPVTVVVPAAPAPVSPVEIGQPVSAGMVAIASPIPAVLTPTLEH